MKSHKSTSAVLLLSLLLTLLAPTFVFESIAEDVNITPVNRMYNPNTGEHFYTVSDIERDSLIAAGWSYEGNGWIAPKTGNPVYRLYNPNAGDHHYTLNVSERDSLVAAGWTYEDISFYSADSGIGVPIYRQYNPNCTGAGSHNYTQNVLEKQNLLNAGWQDENIGWYGVDVSDWQQQPVSEDISGFKISDIPKYSGKPVYIVNNNKPFFTDAEKVTTTFETYSNLDSLGRCGVAYANLDKSLMPTEPRGAIGNVKPSGWHTVKYEGVISDLYLYNRCHLIAFMLAGENDNEKNLITGTRYLNIEGMLPYENNVSAYVKSSNNHVLYRVTPVFEGNNLVATGVLMEAYSVEDNGKLQFNVFCYNVQPGVIINYADGSSELDPNYVKPSDDPKPVDPQPVDPKPDTGTTVDIPEGTTYVLNTNTHKFHRTNCSSVSQMSEKNRAFSELSREELINQGYTPCGSCKP